MKTLTESDKAYMAGLFDGDGHVTITKNSYVRKDGRTSFRVRCGFSNTDEPLILYLQDRLEWCSISRQSTWFGGKKVLHIISNSEDDSKKFLDAVLPYLICKKERAALALELLTTAMPKNYCFKNGLPSDVLDKRESLYNRMRVLNRRGLPV